MVSKTPFEGNTVSDGKGSSLYSESSATLSFMDHVNFTVLASDDRALEKSSDLEIEFGGNITWSVDSGLAPSRIHP